MAATAPRTTKPTATRPARGSTRASSSVAPPSPKTPTPTAPHTTKPVVATRPTRGSTRATGSVTPPRPKTPTTDVVKDTAGPAVKLGNAAAAKDPRFQKVMVKLQKSAAQTKQHPSPQRKAAEAQAAARPPAREKLAGAQANQVDTMQSAEGKKPEKSSFLDLLRAEIAKIMPQTLGDTEDFMEGDQPQQLKGAMTGNINQQKEEASGAIKAASSQPPDPSKIEGKAVTPLPTEGVPPAPPAVGAKAAIPLPKPGSEVSLEKSKKDADQQLKDAKLTPRQLQKANDPRFSAVLTAKSTVEKQADSAPKQFRTEEQKTLAQETAKAVAHEKQGLTAFQHEKGKAGPAVKQKQLDAQQKDEARRKEVTDTIEKIYNETKQAVEAKLASLETDVSSMFDRGVEAAMTKMKSEIDRKMDAYKEERYSGWTGKAAWVSDKLFGLPDEVNVFYEEGQAHFTQDLDALVVEIAATVETRLKEAKDEITKGQKRIQDYVQCLPEDLRAVGKAAEKEMKSRFEELQQRVDEKKNDLAQSLAQQYKDASDKANEQLKKMQEENKGLVNKLIDAVGEVVKILLEFKDRIMDMLKQSLSIILSIVTDPIGFLGNLLDAIALGVKQFASNIWTHLKEGFMAWLLGSLDIKDIEIPKEFSPGSMFKLVLQVLGLTYDRIRAKAVRLVGERTVKVLETTGRLLITFVTGGPAALWEMIKEYLPNLMETVLDKIQNWVVTTIINVGIPTLAAMFTPVGAIIEAISTIYAAVMFFIERRNQILDFVQSIINSVKKIVDGDISGAAKAIEDALTKAIPLIIDFLARLLKLGGIASTIRGIIREIRHDVEKAVDLVIAKIVGGIGKLFGKGKKDEKPDERTLEQKQQDLDKAIIDADILLKDEEMTEEQIKQGLVSIQSKYKLTSLELVIDTKDGDMETVHVHGEINPRKDTAKGAISRFIVLVGNIYMLKKKYRNKKFTRDRCYGKSYRQDVYDWKDKELEKMSRLAPKGKYEYKGEFFSLSTASIDHYPLMVVQHWNQYGRKQNQQQRKNYFNGGDAEGNAPSMHDMRKHLRVVPLSKNSSEGASSGEEYLDKVTKDFKGPKEGE